MRHQRRVHGIRRMFPIGEKGLLLAAEALQMQDRSRARQLRECPRRDPSAAACYDWEDSAVLLLARLRLDQLVTSVRQITGIDDPLCEPERTQEELRCEATMLWMADQDRYEAEGGEVPQDYDTLVYSVEEA